MAADFLRSHGIDINAEMSRIQSQPNIPERFPDGYDLSRRVQRITNVSLPRTPPGSRWTACLHPMDGHVWNLYDEPGSWPQHSALDEYAIIDGRGALLAPSLCHPHLHLDKAYLLSHPKYSHLRLQRGDFAEAMELTGKAKTQFTPEDLLERGQRVIDESVAAGVTHMRAFVELDAGVGTKCLDAGLELKRRAEGGCVVQICAFAQLPLFSPSPDDPDGQIIRDLLEIAVRTPGVDVVGSTPYVEDRPGKQKANVQWMTEMAITHKKHLDFHLDYNLDSDTEPLVWHVLETLHKQDWMSRNPGRTIVLGHCTRLTLFKDAEWPRLETAIGDLPISFVGLPTSDLFMMRTGAQPEVRGTLGVPRLIGDFGINACLGVNNVGNAFTPHGSCDPLTLACNGVGIYQAGTEKDAEVLYECVSTRAREAIGFGRTRKGSGEEADVGLQVQEGDEGALVLFGAEEVEWRTRRSVGEAVWGYDHCKGRRTFLGGRLVE